MSQMELLLTKEEYEKAIQAINKVADAVSKSEWNYERLKTKREKLFLQAITAYWKSISLKEDYLYPIRLTYSTYEYDCGMLNENLTKELLSLDGVNSNGNEEIRKQRKDQVKRILALQDKITELHKAAIQLSVFYRSCVSQARYQALLGQESDEPEVTIPPSPMISEPSSSETPVIQRKSSLKRNKSVHHVNILTPEEFDNRKNEIENEHACPDDLKSEILEMEEEELRRLEEEEKRKQVIRERLEAFRRYQEEQKDQEAQEAQDQPVRERMEPVQREEEESEESEEKRGIVEEEEESEESEEERGIVEEEEEIESDYHPRFQWFQQGDKLLLMLLNVDFDQQSLRCITKRGKDSTKIIIQGYRIVRMKQPRGYYNLFYETTPSYQYIPFTTVIPLPSVAVDLSSPPSAMYYDDEGTLQITYTLAQPKPRKNRHRHPKHYNPYRESHPAYNPYRGRANEYQAYQPRRSYPSFDSDFPSFGSYWF